MLIKILLQGMRGTSEEITITHTYYCYAYQQPEAALVDGSRLNVDNFCEF